MKIRTGFVSNSSSSSFVCDVCGRVETGYDGKYDTEIYNCINGHSFCEEHLIKSSNFSTSDKRQVLIDECDSKKRSIYLETCPDIEIEKLYNKEHNEYINDNGEVLSNCCPLCSLNEIEDQLLITYLLKEIKKSREEITKELKEKFGTREYLIKSLGK